MALKQSRRCAMMADQEVTGSSVSDGAWRDHCASNPLTRPDRPPTAAAAVAFWSWNDRKSSTCVAVGKQQGLETQDRR